MNARDYIYSLKGMSAEEFDFLMKTMNNMSPKQEERFMILYSGKRQSPTDMLLYTLIGFIAVAGVQRFVTRQIAMGLLYFFTAGLCFIGTIVDLINHRSLAMNYNKDIAYECAQLARMSGD